MMMPTLAARRPGIVFDTSQPPLVDPLPRMDIAAFVGFATAGPISVPVPVEAPDEFHSIFGEDVLLGQSTDDGSSVYGQLGRNVRSFFQAGGRRCWIVRVAAPPDQPEGDLPGAETSAFFVPGVLAAVAGNEAASRSIIAGSLLARSPGSWADLLSANATLTQRLVPVLPSAPGTWLRVGDVAAGDLLSLTYRAEPGLVGYVVVPETSGRPGRRPVRPTALSPRDGFWFARLDPAQLTAVPAPSIIRPLTAGGPTPLPAPPLTLAGWSDEGDKLVFDVTGSVPPMVRPGCWMEIDLPAGLVPGASRGLALLSEVERAEDPAFGGGLVERWQLASGAIWAELSSGDAPPSTAGLTPIVRSLALELWARDAANTWRLAELGLAAPHPRFLGNLASDVDLFGPSPAEITPEFREAITRPLRFPLASGSAGARIQPAFLPLGVEAMPLDQRYQPASHSGRLPGIRDGLAELSADLFLDPALRDSKTASLLGDAFWARYGSSRTEPLPLLGLHGLLDIEEISLAAVPDAAARRWTIQPRTELPLLPPYGLELLAGDNAGQLTWCQLGPVIRVRIESSADPRFNPVQSSWAIASLLTPEGPTSFPSDMWSTDLFVRIGWLRQENDTAVTLTVATDARFTEVLEEREVDLTDWAAVGKHCPALWYWRVRAEDSLGRLSSWSETVWARQPADDFGRCQDNQLLAPFLSATQSGQVSELAWTAPEAGALEYRLELSYEPLFAAARTIYLGSSLQQSIWNPGNRISYFRVAAASDSRLSAWSAAVAVGSVQEERRMVEPVEDYRMDILVQVHAALIILAAARGDLVTVLGLMQHARAREIADYRAALLPAISPGSTVPGESDDLDRALSFAAFYHPWALVRETRTGQGGSVTGVSPEGLAAGIIAARTIASGAWAAPANQVLPGVLGLTPEGLLSNLLPTGLPLNLLVSEPRGFTVLTEWTLGLAGEVRTIHVRRLLILLRRLALREGNAFAFMANDAVLARLVQREFEARLGELFVRGAFAGRVQAEGFQVIADGRINTDATRDLGRFMVELRVAPSEPLSFLTIRLVQTGGDQLSVQGA